MDQHRIEPTEPADLKEVEKHLNAGDEVIVQFSKVEQYPAAVLAKVELLCQKHGRRLMIRFWYHYPQAFSGLALRKIPSAAALTVDCLSHGKPPRDLKEVWNLANLRVLHFGVDDLAETDLLAGPNLRQLEGLGVGPSSKENVDLAPIAGMTNLRELFISKQSKSIEAIGQLTKLESLVLNVKNPVSLDFVPKLKKLRELKLILGGREDLNEAAHPSLEWLELIRVRGLARLDPAMFPKLKKLTIEEQAQLKALAFSAKNAALARIKINLCKGLKSVTGLAKLPKLEELILWNSASLDFESWLAAGLPKSLKRCDFGAGRPKDTALYRQRLNELGYKEPKNHGDG